jgi:hypothetical protein
MPLCEGKNYLVVAREDLSGWVEAREDVVCRHGCFRRLVINGGLENKGQVTAFTKKYSIERV